MDLTNVRSYIDTYVKEFFPYRNDSLYTVLVESLFNTIITDLYKNADDLHLLYEENELFPNIYDQLLASYGVHLDLISEMSPTDKYIFINALSDFYRYKGTIDFFKKTASSFNEKFNIYELYIDKIGTRWVLKPKSIYISNKSDNIRPENLEYEKIYNEVPSLMISIDQLDEMYNESLAQFPIKSNLLFLDYENIQDVSIINNLIFSTFYKEYYDKNFDIYFSDNIFTITLSEILYLWYYLLFYYYDSSYLFKHIQYIVEFSPTLNPYNISDLDGIISIYNNLETSDEISEFYYNYIETHFELLKQNKIELTLDDFFNNLMAKRNDIAQYISDRLFTIENEDGRKKEVIRITNEIFNSLILSKRNQIDSYFLKYFDYFLNTLSQITIDPEKTITYKILYNFKPFHTEFISKSNDLITINDKFDNVKPNVLKEFMIEMSQHDLLSDFEEDVNFTINKISKSSLSIGSKSNFNFIIKPFKEDIVNQEIYIFFLYSFLKSHVNVNDSKLFYSFDLNQSDGLVFNSLINTIFNLIQYDNELRDILIEHDEFLFQLIQVSQNRINEFYNQMNIFKNDLSDPYNYYDVISLLPNYLKNEDLMLNDKVNLDSMNIEKVSESSLSERISYLVNHIVNDEVRYMIYERFYNNIDLNINSNLNISEAINIY